MLFAIVAWISMLLSAASVLLTPLVLGEKIEITYGTYIARIVGAIFTFMLALRVLGWI